MKHARLLRLNDISAVTRQEKANLFADTLNDTFTINPDVNSNSSKVTESTVRKFLKPSPLLVRKTYHQDTGWIRRHPKSRITAGSDGKNIRLKTFTPNCPQSHSHNL